MLSSGMAHHHNTTCTNDNPRALPQGQKILLLLVYNNNSNKHQKPPKHDLYILNAKDDRKKTYHKGSKTKTTGKEENLKGKVPKGQKT